MRDTQYENVALGGTFDHLHAGHKALLDYAFSSGKYVYIGLTTEQYIHTKRFRQAIDPYKTRLKELQAYLAEKKYAKRTTIIPLNDMYGIAGTEDSLQALIITPETEENGRAINLHRKRMKLHQLVLKIFPLIKGADAKVIRSTRIRTGEINRMGQQYISLFEQKINCKLPVYLRSILRKPLGEVISGKNKTEVQTAQEVRSIIRMLQPSLVISVGDIVTSSLNACGFIPRIAIIDHKTRRNEVIPGGKLKKKTGISNPAGSIQFEAVRTIAKTISDSLVDPEKRLTITIDGEEDLLALPAILLAPLKSIVLYGQFEYGIVMVHVDEKIKAHVASLISQFE